MQRICINEGVKVFDYKWGIQYCKYLHFIDGTFLFVKGQLNDPDSLNHIYILILIAFYFPVYAMYW